MKGMDGGQLQHIAHCSSCGCKMDISQMEPYTNVVCPDCEHHTRVKCELGPYLLIGRHAVGGMSMVFKARDVTLNREVAIKILNEDYSRDEVRMRQFEHEALITAAISHPHVVRVFTVPGASRSLILSSVCSSTHLLIVARASSGDAAKSVRRIPAP